MTVQGRPLGDVLTPRKEKDNPANFPDLPYIGLEHVEAHTTKLLGTGSTAEMRSSANHFHVGDVLYSRLRPYLNKVWRADREGLCSSEFIVLPCSDEVDPDFLRYRLSARDFVTFANGLDAGDRPRVNFKQISSFLLPPFSLAVQRRIVSKIDELFSRIDEGEAGLARVEKLVERYRQSVLKAAVTGELTRDWRAVRKRAGEPVESGAALLARILQARRAAWESAELAKLKAKGKPPTDERWKQKYQEPVPPDTTDQPELPEGWVWASMDQLTTKVTSGSRDWKAYYGRGDGVFVMAQNVRPCRFDMTDVQQVDPPDGDRDAERSEIAENDLLITIVGANTGDVCRVDRPVSRHYVCQSVALMRPAYVSLSEYITVYLNTKDAGRAELDKEIYGAGRPHLGFDQLRAIRVPIPPVAERASILDSLSDSESQLSDVRGNLTGLNKTSAALRQSILKAAFSGQLVPQDPRDEPASKLLERIAAERASEPAKARRGRKPRASTVGLQSD